jgi:hypothetical protein
MIVQGSPPGTLKESQKTLLDLERFGDNARPRTQATSTNPEVERSLLQDFGDRVMAIVFAFCFAPAPRAKQITPRQYRERRYSR